MTKPRRWYMKSQETSITDSSGGYFVAAADHDRVVAGKDAEIDKLTRKLNAQYRRNGKLVVDDARQAKVIENIKQALDNPATRSNEALVQIREAIEKGERT